MDIVYVSNFPVPNTAIANGVATLKIDRRVDVRLSSEGSWEAHHLDTFTTGCNVDPSLFPFDEQVSELVLISEETFTLVAEEEVGIQHQYFTNSSEWEVIKVAAETREYQSHGTDISCWGVVKHSFIHSYGTLLTSVVFKFHLKRQSTFHIVTVMFPLTLLSFRTPSLSSFPPLPGRRCLIWCRYSSRMPCF